MEIAWSDLTQSQKNLLAKDMARSFSPYVHLSRVQAWWALNDAAPAVVWSDESIAIAEESKAALGLHVAAYLTEE